MPEAVDHEGLTALTTTRPDLEEARLAVTLVDVVDQLRVWHVTLAHPDTGP